MKHLFQVIVQVNAGLRIEQVAADQQQIGIDGFFFQFG